MDGFLNFADQASCHIYRYSEPGFGAICLTTLLQLGLGPLKMAKDGNPTYSLPLSMNQILEVG